MMRFLMVCGLVLTAALPARAETADIHRTLVSNAVNGYIRPEFETFSRKVEGLEEAVATLCAAPGPDAYDRAAKAYSDALASFARINFIRFGPLSVDHRLERLVFWPDRKSTGRRQAEAIVATKDETALDLPSLRQKSVAVQGLSAMQAALFDDGRGPVLAAGAAGAFRCAYAMTVMENVTRMADAMAAEWRAEDGYSRLLLEPGPDNAAFRNAQEAASDVLAALTTGLQIVRDQQVGPILGASHERANPKLALFRRSGNSLVIMSAGVEGLRDYLAALDIAPLLDEDNTWLVDTLAFEFRNVLTALAALEEPLTDTLRAREAYDKLDFVAVVLRSVRETIAETLSVALKIQVGFNALDGD